MDIKEDGAEKTKQLAIGMIIVSVAGWLAWQWWFGIGFFEGNALVEGQYGSAASEMVKVAVFLVTQIGAIALGLFRTGVDILISISGFLFGSNDKGGNNQSVNINLPSNPEKVVNGTVHPAGTASPVSRLNDGDKVLVKKDVPIFRTDEKGNLVRDLELESHICGPRTKSEILEDAIDALVVGDGVRVKERFKQLQADDTPKKTPIDGEVKSNAESKTA